jgi:uncharacterized protein YceH (UPF0502 family)
MLPYMVELTPEEVRVLGCLLEKEATTPDQYPLTMNALLLACNQSSNRYPVMTFDEATVTAAMDLLRERKLARVVHSPHNRATKYRHVLLEVWPLTSAELAVLAVLLLRGPQTINELRTRTERYGDLAELGGVEGVLHRLKNRHEESFVMRLDRSPGQREERYAHLLAGEVSEAFAPPVASSRPSTGNRVEQLVEEVQSLRQELGQLRRDFEELKSQLS